MDEERPGGAAPGEGAPGDMPGTEVTEVAVGAVVDAEGRILVARRGDHMDQGGLWEFPGGKLHPGEGVDDALVRELHEELGIQVEPGRPLIEIPWDYGHRRVRLHVREVRQWTGVPRGVEGQPLGWVHPGELRGLAMPAANQPIARALELPAIYCISDEEPRDDEGWLRVLEHNFQAGRSLVQMRRHDLDDDAFRALAREAVAVARRHHGVLLLNRHPEMAAEVGAHGVHLSASALRQLEGRPLPTGRWVAASCHGPEEVERAARLGLDFVVLSPVQPTASHPTAVPIGWARFEEWVREAALPVFALGGLAPSQASLAFHAGGQGTAGIRGFWNRP